MRWNICYTNTHASFLYDWFIPTLEGNNDVFAMKHHYFVTSPSRHGSHSYPEYMNNMFVPKTVGRGDAFAPDFMEILHYKVKEICRSIIDSFGEIIVWSDVDIQFFKPAEEIRRELLKQLGDADIAFQNEGNDTSCNTGLFVMRCNERTLALFSYVHARCIQLHDNEQPVMWQTLREEFASRISLNWKLLDGKFWALTHWDIKDELYLHHANLTFATTEKGSVELKDEQLADVRTLVKRFGNYEESDGFDIGAVKWTFIHPDGSTIASGVRLLKDGHIAGYRHHNEHVWKLHGGRIAFLSEDGKITSLYALRMQADGERLHATSYTNGLQLLEE